ncbi:unnamed protein product [Peniophora sp. CBMAI 1063]|nr:unnamed protein product [Peniophora sp. CBMAI 1063]
MSKETAIASADGAPVFTGAQAQPSETSTSHSVQPLPEEFYTPFLSDVAKARKPSPIRGLFPLEKKPGVLSLLAGKPSGSMFPFTSVTFGTRDPTNPDREYKLDVAPDLLGQGLQYGGTDGIPPAVEWLTMLQETEHKRNRNEGWRVSVTAGSQDAIYKAVTSMVNPGDSIFVEKPVYAGVIPMFQSLHCEMIEIETDSHGILSSSLRQALENWPAGKPKPKILYTVPYGCNPTGMTATLERRLEVLELARQHNFMIFEDDPYYYLYFGTAPRIPSYFTLEAQTGPDVGRVLRFDSFSKILSAGVRLGFATGPAALLKAMDSHTASANLQASSFVQAVIVTLLSDWGYEGFKKHTENVSAFYREKRDVFENAMRRHLDGLAEWETPQAGMFFWFKLLLGQGENDDSQELVRTKAYENGVLALPGTVFLPNGARTAYVRASFSLLEEHDVDEALRRLGETIRKERGA